MSSEPQPTKDSTYRIDCWRVQKSNTQSSHKHIEIGNIQFGLRLMLRNLFNLYSNVVVFRRYSSLVNSVLYV